VHQAITGGSRSRATQGLEDPGRLRRPFLVERRGGQSGQKSASSPRILIPCFDTPLC
jgi:hypothetical protein